MRIRTVLLALFLSVISSVGLAQDAAQQRENSPLPVAAQVVEVSASDGLTLIGEFYRVDPARPTVLLLHQLYTNRLGWHPVLAPLLEAGYNLLSVDVRGYGATGGTIYWNGAADDVGTWLVWLREVAGVRADAISTMGSSMGSTLAILGCDRDALCRTAIAISPGWNYFGLHIGDNLSTKPILAIYAERDRWPALGIPLMLEAAPETLATQIYAGNAHGMDLIESEFDSIVPLVLGWLAAHGG